MSQSCGWSSTTLTLFFGALLNPPSSSWCSLKHELPYHMYSYLHQGSILTSRVFWGHQLGVFLVNSMKSLIMRSFINLIWRKKRAYHIARYVGAGVNTPMVTLSSQVLLGCPCKTQNLRKKCVSFRASARKLHEFGCLKVTSVHAVNVMANVKPFLTIRYRYAPFVMHQ